MRTLRIVLLALACAAAGCANFSAIAPGDSEVVVGQKVGAPTTVWKNADGSELWQYPQGYYATQTFMVTIGPDRRVQEVHQALSEPYFSKVQAGMSRDDIFRLLGRPREIWYFPPRDEEVWTWRYYENTYMSSTSSSTARVARCAPSSGWRRSLLRAEE